MKKIDYILCVFLLFVLTSCNSWRCEFTHPDEMSPALRELCVAKASAPEVNQNVWK